MGTRSICTPTEGFVIISEVIAPSLNLPEMIALLALSGAFVAPLPSRAAARARMAADDAPAPSDRYTMADPTGLLRSFFTRRLGAPPRQRNE